MTDSKHSIASAAAATFLLASMLGGCTLWPRREATGTPPVPPPALRDSRQPGDSGATSSSAEEPSRSGLTEAQLEMWNDPEFQKRFTESYLAETEIEPRVTLDERDEMQKVMALISKDKMDDAARALEKVLNGRRGEAASAVYDFTLANIYFQREQLDQAAQRYEAAVKKHPKFRRAWRNLAICHVRQKGFPKAIESLTRVIELGGGEALIYGMLGFSYSMTGDPIAAESAYRMAALIDAGEINWKMGLARSYFLQQRHADAVALCGSLIEAQPDRADLWLLQANAYIGLNQPLKAAENYELVDRLGQSTAESLYTLGDIYVNEGIFDLAVGAYGRAMDKRSEGRPDRALRAAKVMIGRGALDQTQRLVEKTESVYGERLGDEDRKDLLKLRARLAVARGAGDQEADILKQIVAIDPLDGEALILLGQHSEKTGDIEQAINYLERAEALEKHEADAKTQHGRLLVNAGKYAEALPLLRSAQELKPRDSLQKYIDQVERFAKNR
ncbi:MAG: tetratricopeptide repeat protein [Planctomycetes bacterium]|nr:tetratricopeptide repeat protein [Planctomycetota bacterium]